MKPLSNKPGRGILFKVTDKPNPKGPDWRGGVNVNEVEYELVAWERVSARGTPYVSLAVALPRDETATADLGQDADLDRSLGARRMNDTR